MRSLTQQFVNAVVLGAIDTNESDDFGFSLSLELDSWKEINPKKGTEVTKRTRASLRILGKTATSIGDAIKVIANEPKIQFRLPSDVSGKVTMRLINRPMTGERAAVLIAWHAMLDMTTLFGPDVNVNAHLVALGLQQTETAITDNKAETPTTTPTPKKNGNNKKTEKPELPESRANIGEAAKQPIG